MTNLMSKSSLYDMLSMIIPGFITLFSIVQIVGCGATEYFSSSDGLAIPRYVYIFVLSYVVGLFIHHISKWLFDPCLRNNPKHIKVEKERFDEELEKLKNAREVLKAAEERPDEYKEDKKRKEAEDIVLLDDYYKEYYNVIKTSSVTIMEAQISFLRSMIVVIKIILVLLLISLLPLLIAHFSSQVEYSSQWLIISPICERGTITIISFILLLFLECASRCLMFRIQKKIYYNIFMDSHYLDIVKEQDRKLGETMKKNEVGNSENEQN